MGLFFQKRKIKKALMALGAARVCYPIEIFSTSRMIADTEDYDYARSLIIENGDHPNAFVRRCMLVAIRFIGNDFPSSVSDYISKSLSDENAWVRYDAAWIIKDFGTTDDNDFSLLKSMAGDFLTIKADQLDDTKVEKADDYASKMAAQAIYAQRGHMQ